MKRLNFFPFVRARLGFVPVAAALWACGGDSEMAEMPGMEGDHAAHMPGMAAPSETDTLPALGRGLVQLTSEQEQALGVTYTAVERISAVREIRTVGRIDAPEGNIADITPKTDGFVEELLVATTGEAVLRGQPLLTIYSPALVAAQEELLTARRLAAQVDPAATEAWSSAQSMLEASRRRLAWWDITDEQIERLEQTGEVTKTLRLVAPVSGIVLEKDVVEGQRITSGTRLYRIADLSTVWVEGEVFERDLQFVEVGSQAHIEVTAYPGEHMMGTVSFVYPVVEIASRTNRVRVSVPNPGLRFKPGMFATVFFEVAAIQDDIAVPLEAVVVTGERNLVFVRDEAGVLMPHEVVLGARAGDQVQILSGLAEGETIVASANFLIDAESRLGATGGGMPGMQHAGHGEEGR
ncbi:efflux RND transporter periplasmic adaptor subunit [Candidatus Palauibacter soopunensis]|uniref:efflux RND transporter periplasmic adaptor subunit n=1 Tax=Candidatus Palauibacter soopunensis TaxID=3056739 RepID=UPI0023982442|nr:efflux RND transporter periplasmic adaptor subunit [Candidatus Palauibacter soopunensis]MDE2877765.1 efflux RND transporter periplasmic adaptor subunit [Candidatus Palauibacter soopunensis]